jgi:hypothetical protein
MMMLHPIPEVSDRPTVVVGVDHYYQPQPQNHHRQLNNDAGEYAKDIIIYILAGIAVLLGILVLTYVSTVFVDWLSQRLDNNDDDHNIAAVPTVHNTTDATAITSLSSSSSVNGPRPITTTFHDDHGSMSCQANLWGLETKEREWILQKLIPMISFPYHQDELPNHVRTMKDGNNNNNNINHSNDTMMMTTIAAAAPPPSSSSVTDIEMAILHHHITDSSKSTTTNNINHHHHHHKRTSTIDSTVTMGDNSVTTTTTTTNPEDNVIHHEMKDTTNTTTTSIISPTDHDVDTNVVDNSDRTEPEESSSSPTTILPDLDSNNNDNENDNDNNHTDHYHMCAICLSSYEPGVSVLTGSICQHMFHASCCQQWLLHHDHCPYCRTNMILPQNFRNVALQTLSAQRIVELSTNHHIRTTTTGSHPIPPRPTNNNNNSNNNNTTTTTLR